MPKGKKGYSAKQKKIAELAEPKNKLTAADFKILREKEKEMKVKGVDVSSLTKRQQQSMKKHSQHHTKKHMQYMLNSMKRGATFTQAHKRKSYEESR